MKSGCQEEAGLRPGILAFLTGVQHKLLAPGSESSWGGGPTESHTVSSVSTLSQVSDEELSAGSSVPRRHTTEASPSVRHVYCHTKASQVLSPDCS